MSILIDSDAQGVTRVTLNRPEVHNAFNEGMIGDLKEAFSDLGKQDGIRVIVLNGAGRSFSAGADLNWMRRAAEQDEEMNREDARGLAEMFETINACPKPVIGLVHGGVFGGGVGLTACCDVVVAAPGTQFGLTEVRLGLIPAVISPFVLSKIGMSASRRYMLSGERFDATEALRIGLVHQVADDLEVAAQPLIQAFVEAAPAAVADIKDLLSDIAHKGTDIAGKTASRIAARRASDEGREGIGAFLDKRKPQWDV
ncbi:enoyl-CoA hydratase/isomerase family protein [Asticcacaulis biprosthecium C19]|uniref:Enoyl-CoA hydratase/isomerase family protein n=1 Tax=Asticcacaulis biprosthecium C19 TaxID=715226 RepID=F4QKV9_9CAUL|nr:enoyl-CoA hydratase-related protein [Asticcacaulis biprosthecium]EGF92182.1 enoyl-CoA hydratase/isomerase family protein [Asticcacaulis biprosthecium C19]